MCLLWGFRHPDHERRTAALVEEAQPGAHVSMSHETAGVFREYERCATTVVDAALSPLMRGYLERLIDRCRGEGLPAPEVMLSSGGAADAATAGRHASWTVLSGPAGGAVGAAHAGERAGAGDAVGLDMGGTSCDVSVSLGGGAAVGTGREVGGRALALPMVDVHTVGAGGGSIAWCDAGGVLRVGPRSAGADPGPACYGRGGESPTVTDADLLLGRLAAGSPLAGGVRLDRAAAERALSALGAELGLSAMETAEGVVRVVAAEMAGAVRVVTVERGIDPRDLALVAFGGAGPLHAAEIAEELEMRRVVVPTAGGMLSALGLVLSERRRDVVESVLLTGAELTDAGVRAAVERLGAEARERLGDSAAELRVTHELRYAGQAFELPVEAPPEAGVEHLRREFERAHESRYGHTAGDVGLELVTIRVTAAVPGAGAPREEPATAGERGTRPLVFPAGRDGGPRSGPGRRRAGGSGRDRAGRRHAGGASRMGRERRTRGSGSGAARMSLGPVTLQVMLGALRAACEEMGAVLVRSAHSANIKERRDASTALFDADGAMVMQAEHIPVHLGAMPSAVAAVLGREPPARAGLDPERPLPRRHPPARHHGDPPALPRGGADRLRRQPRAPRRRGRAGAGQHARRLAHAGGRGGGDPAHPGSPPTVLHRPRRAHAQPAPARGRPPGAARGGAGGRRACGRPGGALRAGHPAGRPWPRRRTTPSGARGPGSPSWRTGPARRATCSRPPTATSSCACDATVNGDELTLDFDGHGCAARRQPQLPAGRDALRRVLRPAGAHRPRRAALLGCLPPAHGPAPPRARC